MINVNVRLLDFMDATPVIDADVTVTVKVAAKVAQGDRRTKITFIDLGGAEAFSTERLTSAADGTVQCSFDVSAAFQRQRQRARPGAELLDVLALLSFHVVYFGVEGDVNFVKDADESQDDALFRAVEKELDENRDFHGIILIDFAKTIVGHTTYDSATLWFCLHGQLQPDYRAACMLYEPASPGLPWLRSGLDHEVGSITTALNTERPRTDRESNGKRVRPVQVLPVEFDPGRAHTAVLTFPKLKPATTYGFALWLRRAGEAELPKSVRVLARGVVTTARPHSDRFSFVFGSCHKPTEEPKEVGLDRWLELAKRQDYDLMLLIGDQIYGDEIEKYWPDDKWCEKYVKRYHQLWNYWPMREVIRRTPTYMVTDDHEVLDDWGTKEIEPKDGGPERVLHADKAYRIFQQSHNPGGYDGSIHYTFRRGPASFFVMDSRSARSTTPYQAAFPILGQSQYEALRAWAKSEETRAADVIFFVSPVPIAFLPVEEILRLIAMIKDVSGPADFIKGGWDELKKSWWILGPGAFAVGGIVGVLGQGATEKKIKEKGLADLTTHDLADSWTYGPNQKDMARVLNCLFNLANDIQDDGRVGSRPRAVLVLGGDVHSGSMHIIAADRQEGPHVCSLTDDGRLWHVTRAADGKWSPFGDVKAEILREYPRSQNPGFFLDVDCVGIRGDLHVVGVTRSTVLGRTQTGLVHTIRSSPTKEFRYFRWQQWTSVLPHGNAPYPPSITYPPSIKSTSCAGVAGALHVCVITSDGQLWHGIRHAYVWGWEKTAANWPTGYKPNAVKEASCAGFAGELHLCAITNEGRLWHTIRRSDRKWSPFGDVRAEVLGTHHGSPDPGALFGVGCSIGVAGELHVCTISNDGGLWHTVRRADGSAWSPFADVRAEVSREHPGSTEPGRLLHVKCSIGIADELHVWSVTEHGSLVHAIRRANGTWLPFESHARLMVDVACATAAGEPRRNPTVLQLTSSPISHPPATDLIYEKVIQHIEPGKNIGWFDLIRTRGKFEELVTAKFGDEKARFPLDDTTEHRYEAQFLELLATQRNFGRVSVERVSQDRRVYRFYISIEGQSSTLWRAMQLDLDNPQVSPTDIPNGLGILGLRGSLTSLQVHPNAARIDEWLFSKDENAIRGVGDLNGDGIDEFIITSNWGIGVLCHDGNRWRQLFGYQNGAWFGGWQYDSGSNRIERLGDFDGDRSIEVLITSAWGIGILKYQGDTFGSPVIHPAGTRFGGWLYSPNDRISGVGDFDGDSDGKAEILITSAWGIGILKQQGDTFDSPVIHPAGTRFGGWLYSVSDRISGVGDFDGDGKVEILITSDWGIGILKQQGNTFESPVIHPAGTRFGGWLYSVNDRISGVGDFDGDGKAEILITSDWGIGILKQQGNTFESLALMPTDSWFGGWHYDSNNNRIAGVGDFDGDGREEFLITSPWGIGLLSLLGDSFWCPDQRAYGSAIGNWLLQPTDRIVGIGNFTRSRGRELLIQSRSVLPPPRKVNTGAEVTAEIPTVL